MARETRQCGDRLYQQDQRRAKLFLRLAGDRRIVERGLGGLAERGDRLGQLIGV